MNLKWCKRPFLGEKGLTLLEVLMSLVVISVSSIFILQAFAKISEVQNRIDYQITSYAIGMSKMSEARAAIATGDDSFRKKSGMQRTPTDDIYQWFIKSESIEETEDLEVLSVSIKRRESVQSDVLLQTFVAAAAVEGGA